MSYVGGCGMVNDGVGVHWWGGEACDVVGWWLCAGNTKGVRV